jgi:hypothetical protein
LTDGAKLYFADFGLATSLNFDLSDAEIEFFHRHKIYDLAHGIFAISYSSPEEPEIPVPEVPEEPLPAPPVPEVPDEPDPPPEVLPTEVTTPALVLI